LGLKKKITKEEEKKLNQEKKINKGEICFEGRKKKRAVTKWEFF